MAACSSSGTSDATFAEADIANPGEVSCRTIVKTGTRIGTKACKTNCAWAFGSSQGRNQGRTMAEGIQRGSMQNETISGN